jgi:hypothetical protein
LGKLKEFLEMSTQPVTIERGREAIKRYLDSGGDPHYFLGVAKDNAWMATCGRCKRQQRLTRQSEYGEQWLNYQESNKMLKTEGWMVTLISLYQPEGSNICSNCVGAYQTDVIKYANKLLQRDVKPVMEHTTLDKLHFMNWADGDPPVLMGGLYGETRYKTKAEREQYKYLENTDAAVMKAVIESPNRVNQLISEWRDASSLASEVQKYPYSEKMTVAERFIQHFYDDYRHRLSALLHFEHEMRYLFESDVIEQPVIEKIVRDIHLDVISKLARIMSVYDVSVEQCDRWLKGYLQGKDTVVWEMERVKLLESVAMWKLSYSKALDYAAKS